MKRSAMASLPMLSWMKRTRSARRSASSTTEAWAMPSDDSSVRLFTISGKVSWRGVRTRWPRGNTWKAGAGMRW